MSKCPINSHLTNQVISVWTQIYDYLKSSKTDCNTPEAIAAYKTLWSIIAEIFSEDFFSKLNQEIDLHWVDITWVHKLFAEKWFAQIMNFFHTEKKKWRFFPPLEWSKLYPNDAVTIIDMGWQHACFLIGTLLRKTIESWESDEQFSADIDEAKRFTMALARTHLYIETSIVNKIEEIFERWSVNTDSIYSGIYSTAWFDKPALGCPAIFFWDKRVWKSLFECMRQKMEREYRKAPSAKDRWKCPIHKIRLLISAIIVRLS